MNVGDCSCPCPNPVITQIPGSEGDAGTNGTDGAAGANAYALTDGTAGPMTKGLSYSFVVDDGTPIFVGATIAVEDAGNIAATLPGYFLVTASALHLITGTFLDIAANENGSTVASGKTVLVTGPAYASPVAIADGGTNATTKAAAQTSLGLGQNATFAQATGLTQDLTNAFALVAGATATAPAAGVYLVMGFATVSFNGVTFADRIITVRAQNTTAATTISSSAKLTQSPTTAELPSHDYLIPFKTVTLALNAVVELQIMVDTVESAGDCEVNEGSICLVPLSLS